VPYSLGTVMGRGSRQILCLAESPLLQVREGQEPVLPLVDGWEASGHTTAT
jgi:hypothetical protein